MFPFSSSKPKTSKKPEDTWIHTGRMDQPILLYFSIFYHYFILLLKNYYCRKCGITILAIVYNYNYNCLQSYRDPLIFEFKKEGIVVGKVEVMANCRKKPRLTWNFTLIKVRKICHFDKKISAIIIWYFVVVPNLFAIKH